MKSSCGGVWGDLVLHSEFQVIGLGPSVSAVCSLRVVATGGMIGVASFSTIAGRISDTAAASATAVPHPKQLPILDSLKALIYRFSKSNEVMVQILNIGFNGNGSCTNSFVTTC